MQVLPIVGMGLQIFGGLQAAQGQAAGYRYAAAQAERKAMAARTAADQTDTQLREELMTTLGNIRAVRSAAGVLPDSPTGIVLEDEETRISDRQRRIKVGSLIAQSEQSLSDASFYRSMAGSALNAGFLSVFAKGISGLAGLGSGY